MLETGGIVRLECLNEIATANGHKLKRIPSFDLRRQRISMHGPTSIPERLFRIDYTDASPWLCTGWLIARRTLALLFLKSGLGEPY
jgi:hypothetical protein